MRFPFVMFLKTPKWERRQNSSNGYKCYLKSIGWEWSLADQHCNAIGFHGIFFSRRWKNQTTFLFGKDSFDLIWDMPSDTKLPLGLIIPFIGTDIGIIRFGAHAILQICSLFVCFGFCCSLVINVRHNTRMTLMLL